MGKGFKTKCNISSGGKISCGAGKKLSKEKIREIARRVVRKMFDNNKKKK